MRREHHQHSELFQDIYRILDEKYHPCPSMNYVIIDNILTFPPTRTCSYFVMYLDFPCYPTYAMFYHGVLPFLMSRMS